MAITDAALAADLARAGLEFMERVNGEVNLPLPSPPPYYSPASCREEHGRFDANPDEIVGVDDPDLPAKVNAGWWRMATEYDLIDAQREFLLAVDYRDPESVEPETAWVRVRLADEWDLAGSEVTALGSSFAGLYTERFVPEFTMLSLDHQALLNTTVWGDGTVSTIVIRPDRLPA
ncbi:hypothetical protein [Dactylosporangium sp. NPDC000521]|uniref:hypothetical protein n=1 Tax=Dactylosporangium sp. NPDC000521 TaxID=3363975 RepID=UPI00368B643D